MKHKTLFCIVVWVCILLLSAYYSYSTSSSHDAYSFDSSSASESTSSALVHSNSVVVNPFQQKLEEQKQNLYSSTTHDVSNKHVTGPDPFRAFLEAKNKERMEQARQSPFGK
jgi:hypothetical protein